MKSRMQRFYVMVWGLVVLPLLTVPVGAGESSKAEVKGTLATIDGLPVLRVWGTPEERGYAHGYLLAERFRRWPRGICGKGRWAAPWNDTRTRPWASCGG